MDIYSILSSKPHNPHYLTRYIAFVRYYQQNTNSDLFTHKHHICPKAADMFPEYSSLSVYKWNRIDLTPRQHFIAHILLWKTFPQSLSQMHALWQMKHKNEERMNSRLYEKLMTEHSNNLSGKFKGTIVVRDNNGDFIRMPSSEFNSMIHTPISKDRVIARNVKGEYEVVDLYDFKYRRDLVGTTKGMKWWTDGIQNVVAFDAPNSKFIEGIAPITTEEKRMRVEQRLSTLYSNYSKDEISKMRSVTSKKYWDNVSPDKRIKSEQTKYKMSLAAKIKNPGFTVEYQCPKCGKSGQKANISKHHGLNGEKCRWA